MAAQQDLQSLFNDLDRNQDGKVSINDLFLSPSLSAIILSETKASSPQEIIAQYDLDKDGSITFEELKQAVEKASNLG